MNGCGAVVSFTAYASYFMFTRYEYQFQFPLLLKSAMPTCIRLSSIYPDDCVIRAIWKTVIRLYHHSPNEFFYFVYTLILRFFLYFQQDICYTVNTKKGEVGL